jgi:hypothetical protein
MNVTFFRRWGPGFVAVAGILTLLALVFGCEDAIGAKPFTETDPDEGLDTTLVAAPADVYDKIAGYGGHFDPSEILEFTFSHAIDSTGESGDANSAAIKEAVNNAFKNFVPEDTDSTHTEPEYPQAHYDTYYTTALKPAGDGFNVTVVKELAPVAPADPGSINRFDLGIGAEKLTVTDGDTGVALKNKSPIAFTVWNLGGDFDGLEPITVAIGEDFAGNSITVKLIGTTFATIKADIDVTSWFSPQVSGQGPFPSGVLAKTDLVAAGANTMVINLEGTVTNSALNGDWKYNLEIPASVGDDSFLEVTQSLKDAGFKLKIRPDPENATVTLGDPQGWAITGNSPTNGPTAEYHTSTKELIINVSNLTDTFTYDPTLVLIGGTALAAAHIEGGAPTGYTDNAYVIVLTTDGEDFLVTQASIADLTDPDPVGYGVLTLDYGFAENSLLLPDDPKSRKITGIVIIVSES